MKNLIKKLKEKWFWYKHPNLEYQVETQEEKSKYRKWMQTDEAKQLLGSDYQETLDLLK